MSDFSRALLSGSACLALVLSGRAEASVLFAPGDLVVSVEGNGSNTAAGGTGNTGSDAGVYLDNEAAPLTLDEFTTTGTNQTPVTTLELPQTSSGGSAISGEYGSSSEATLQLTGNGEYLTIMGYGVNASRYNAHDDLNGAGTALAQSCSLGGPTSNPCGATPQVPRVIAEIGDTGVVNTSTVLYNIFNENNPRSVYSETGTSFYISGQGSGRAGDTSGGVFYVPGIGPGQTAIPITGQDASSNTVSQDTREVQIYNNTLYVSVDSKEGSGNNRDFIGTLGSPPATGLYESGAGPTMLPGFGNSGGTGKVTITGGAHSDGNGLNAGDQINLSPENYFFANATTLYVADSGDPKNDSATSSVGDGGLQKWTLNTTTDTWSLDYTLASGLDLVLNTASCASGAASATSEEPSCTTGLEGLTGELVDGGSEVDLFATTYTLGDTNASFLYDITDVLADTTASEASGERFTELAEAPADSDFKGVAFAPHGTPVPEPSSLAALAAALAGLAAVRRRARS